MTEDRKSDRRSLLEKQNSDLLRDRIRQLIGNGSARKFASMAGIPPSTLQRVLEGGRPNVDILVAIAQAGGVTVDWLATGEGPKWRAELVAEAERVLSVAEGGDGDLPAGVDLTDFVFLPRLEVRAGAGAGAAVHSEQVVDFLAFRAAWVRQRLGLDPRDLVLIEAVGDSMEPTISSGDLLLIHTGEPRVRDNAIYAIGVDGDLMVKRIQRRMDGTLLVSGDNPAYKPDEIPPGRAGELRVIGRVVWAGGRT